MHFKTSSRLFVRGLILTAIVSLVLLTVSAAAGTARNNFIGSVQEFLGLASPSASSTFLPNAEHQNSKMRPTLGVFATNAVEPIFFDTGAGAVSLITIGTAVTQDFNTLSNTAGSTTNTTLPTGWYLTETGGGARDNEQYGVDTGSLTTGDTYSYGATASTERAFGELRSGTNITTFGAKFTNNTGATISALVITYNGEEWRFGGVHSTVADRLDFQYSIDAADLTIGTWLDADALDFNPPITTGSAAALDGNAAANRTARSGTITGLNVANGASFFIRLTDVDATGADDGLAIDDFTLTPYVVLPPAINVNPSTPKTFPSTFVGSVSPAQTSTVTGSNLTADVVCTAPSTDFQVSSDGSNFGSSATFTQSGGAASGTLSVRFSPQGTGPKSGNVNCASTGATTVPILVSGTGAADPGTVAGDFFRTRFNGGSWTDPNSWESSHDGINNWITSSLVPTTASAGITVMPGQGVNIFGAVSISVDQMHVYGGLSLDTASTLTVTSADGLYIESGASFGVRGTLINNGVMSVAGDLLVRDPATFSGNALTYSGGKLQYLTGNRTTSPQEFPVVNGPSTLDISASGTITLDGPKTVPSRFILGSGTLVAASNLTLGSGCYITRSDGQMTGTPTFLGVVDIDYYNNDKVAGPELPTSATALRDLNLPTSLNLFLANNATVNGTLGLSNGHLYTQTPNTLTIAAGAHISRSNGYVIGNLKKNFVNGSPLAEDAERAEKPEGFVGFSFPVGTSNGYSPVDATANSSTTGSLTVTAVEGPQPNLFVATKGLQRYWTVTPSGLDFSLSFHYLDGDIPGTSNEANYVVRTRQGGLFNTPSGANVIIASNIFQGNTATSAADWTAGEPAAFSPPVPTTTIGVGSLPDFGNVKVGTSSAEQHTSINASNLTGDITCNYTNFNFALSKDNITYFQGSNLTFTPDGSGNVSATLYVKFTPVVQGVISGPTVNCSSPGATTASLGVSGTGANPPDFTSAVTTSEGFSLGTSIVTQGFPAPTCSVTGGDAFPSGLILDPDCTLHGAAAAGTARVYNIIITATNGVAPDAIHNLQLTVNGPPTITSANTATATIGTAFNFQFAATGFPTGFTWGFVGPNPTTLPTGLTLDGSTGIISGTPASGTAGTYVRTIRASSGGGVTDQTFTLKVAPVTPTASNGGPYCSGSTIQLNTPAVAGATYSWTGPNGFTSSVQNPQRTNSTTAFGGVYSPIVTVNGVPSAPGSTTVVVNQTPTTPTASNTGPYQVGNTISLSTAAVGGATYSWTGPNGFTSALQTPTRTGATVADSGTYFVTVTTTGCTSAAGSTNVVVIPTPVISSITPNQGPTTGGTAVTITGSDFTGVTAVSFGGTAATGFTFDSNTQITATAPAHAAGTVDVTITTGGGTSATSGADQFTYIAPPTVTAISPTAGPATGGTSVTVTGTNFTAATAVNFGAAAATTFTVNSPTSITATAPAGTGTVDIRVTTVGGASAISAADQYTFVAAPTITSISPAAGPTTGGTTVTITGTNLSGASAVNFGGTAAATFTVNSATSITATAPAGSAGTVDIRVTTTGGTSATSGADQYTFVAAPTVTSISPTAGPATGGTVVTITGTNLSGASAVNFGGTAAATFTVNSATSITATSPAGVGTVDVRVTTVGGTSATSGADQFTFVAVPTVTSISPTSGTTAGGTIVTITGTNFSGATSVTFGGTAATTFTINSATSITATAPTQAAGVVDVRVTTTGGTSATSAADQFTYISPLPNIQFTAAAFIEDESQTAVIRIDRTGDTTGTSSVTFATTTGGSATAGTCGSGGADYVAVAPTVINFASGETFQNVNVTLCGDMLEETQETINLALSNFTGAAAGTQSNAVLTINDVAAQFRSLTPISITGPLTLQEGITPPANPYPATLTVSGAPTVNGGMRVTLFDVTHASPGNLDILLVGPLGQKMIIMGDAGGSAAINNPTTLTFEDAAGSVLPQSTLITTGKYEPTTWVAGQANFAAPAPAGPYSEPGSVIGGPVTFASVFGTSNPNGQWQLFVRDDGSPNFAPLSNQIAGGWGLQFNVPTAADVTLSGRVMFGERGVRNAQITVTGGSLASPLVVQTGRNGEYTVSGLTAGETYVVTAAARRFTFPQPTRVVTLTDNLAGIDFNAETLSDR